MPSTDHKKCCSVTIPLIWNSNITSPSWHTGCHGLQFLMSVIPNFRTRIKIHRYLQYLPLINCAYKIQSRMAFWNLNLPPAQCAVLRTFCLYLFSYPDSLILHLRVVAILSASSRSCRVTLRRVLCEIRIKSLYAVSCRDWTDSLVIRL
jgi:hypothetical protein